MRPVVSSLLFAALSACVSAPNAGPPPASAMATAVRVGALQAMSARLEDFGPTTAMPDAGQASFRGFGEGRFVRAATGGTTSLVFDVALEADFDRAALTGRFDDFATIYGPAADGALILGDGRISGAGFLGTVTGSLVLGRDEYGAQGTVDGRFLGPDAQALDGVLAVDLGPGEGTVNAEFLAEEQ